MDRFRDLETFVAVAETGGFATAAQRLKASPPAVTRIIAGLEQRLGAALFTRSTRQVRLTEAGQRLLVRAQSLLSDLELAEGEVAGANAVPAGHLTITAPVTMGRLLMPSLLTGFLKAHDRITANVVLLDRISNLIEDGVDVALRVGQLPDSTLIARHVGEVRRMLVASPAYLRKHGRPKKPTDLKQHTFIAFNGLMPNADWSANAGFPKSLKSPLEFNDASAAIAAVEAGEGITIAWSYLAAPRVRDGTLVQILPAAWPPAVPVQLVYPESRLVASKVRAFVDYAAPNLRAALLERRLTPRHPR